jgi:hypothetical protein
MQAPMRTAGWAPALAQTDMDCLQHQHIPHTYAHTTAGTQQRPLPAPQPGMQHTCMPTSPCGRISAQACVLPQRAMPAPAMCSPERMHTCITSCRWQSACELGGALEGAGGHLPRQAAECMWR